MRALSLCWFVAAVVLVFAISPAVSQSADFSFEIYAGHYDPGPDFLEDDVTLGLRVGTWINDRVTLQGTLGFVETSGEFRDGSTRARIDADITLVDVSLGYLVGSQGRRVRALVYGGIGGSFANIDATASTPNVVTIIDGLDRDSFTVHLGFGPIFAINERLYLRLAGGFRWYENREDDEIDREIALSLGWSFRSL